MAQRDKSKYTDKQKRQAEHIEEGYEDKGISFEEAKRRAWATINKIYGGGEKGGRGEYTPDRTHVYEKAGHDGGEANAERSEEEKSKSAKKAAETRKHNE